MGDSYIIRETGPPESLSSVFGRGLRAGAILGTTLGILSLIIGG